MRAGAEYRDKYRVEFSRYRAGAGDAFGTGATWALLRGFDLKTMLQAGTINATSVVGVVGAAVAIMKDTEPFSVYRTPDAKATGIRSDQLRSLSHKSDG